MVAGESGLTWNELLEAERRERLPNFKWEAIRQAILERDGGACLKCGSPACEVDHILPVALGGAESSENLQSLCGECHKKKTALDIRRVSQLKRTKKLLNSRKRGTGFL